MSYYGTRFGCRFGQPHDLEKIGEKRAEIRERCKICGKHFLWNKGYKERIRNERYLKAHVRQFAQDFGPTKRVFMKLYKPEKTTIIL